MIARASPRLLNTYSLRHSSRNLLLNDSMIQCPLSPSTPAWSLDFVLDTLSDGRRFRILCIVDDFSRECLAAVVDTSLGGVRAHHQPLFAVQPMRSRWATRRVAWHYSCD